MSKMIKIKRGLDYDRMGYIPEMGELLWITDTHELWIGDGQMAGGHRISAIYDDRFIPKSEKAKPNGVATLDKKGHIHTSQLPQLAITSAYVVGSEKQQLMLTTQEGDVAIRTDINENFIKKSNNNGDMSDWVKLESKPNLITSVNGKVGVVELDLSDLQGVSLVNPVKNQLLQFNGTAWVNVDADSVGRTEFISLKDTPQQYAGQAGRLVAVTQNEQAVEFINVIDGGTFQGYGQPADVVQQVEVDNKPAENARAEKIQKLYGAYIPKSRADQ